MKPVLDELKIFTGNSHPELANSVCEDLDIPLGQAEVFKFANDNTFVRIQENVRQRDVFIIQPTSFPVNDNLMELLIMIDACKRASAGRITAVIPYYGYGRTDKKDQPRVPITARLVADLLTAAGADRMLTVDLHAGQIQGFFDVPTDNLYASPVFIKDIKKRFKKNKIVIVSPDVGGVTRARAIAIALNVDLAIIDKRRERAGESEVMNIIGDVNKANCIIIDDIVDSAGTICNAAKALKSAGARNVSSYITHGVLSGAAVKKVKNSLIDRLVVTDTIKTTPEIRKIKNIEQLTLAPLLGEAIKRISKEKSVSSLFD